MASHPSGENDSPNRTSRTWIIVIGCLIAVALAAAMFTRSVPSFNRPSVQDGAGQSGH